MRHPNVPESLDGWSILHRMFRFDRRRWDALAADRRAAIAAEAAALFARIRKRRRRRLRAGRNSSATRASLMLTHYARTFDALGVAQARTDKLALRDYLEPLLVVRVGARTGPLRRHREDPRRPARPRTESCIPMSGMRPSTPRWPRSRAIRATRRAWTARIPRRRYVCFYPMNKKRAGADNWYNLPFAERAQMMVEHGKIGRSYHGLVSQVISGSIGFDDWEWGVDLYADDPLVFKKLVYEMRFDEASSRFGEFGRFWTGMQFSIAALAGFPLRRTFAAVARGARTRIPPLSTPKSASLLAACPLSRARAGGCAWCGETLPPRRRTWCSDRCGGRVLEQPLVDAGPARGQTARQIPLQPLRARRAEAALTGAFCERERLPDRHAGVACRETGQPARGQSSGTRPRRAPDPELRPPPREPRDAVRYVPP